MKCFVLFVCVVIIGALSTFTGCGAAEDDPVSWTSVERSKYIQDLTQEEIQQYCQDMRNWGADLFNDPANKSAMCMLLAVAAKLLPVPEDCQESYDRCVETKEGREMLQLDCDPTAGPPQGCEATVDEAATCWEDGLKKMIENARKLTCASSELPDPSDTADSCKVLQEKCPVDPFRPTTEP